MEVSMFMRDDGIAAAEIRKNENESWVTHMNHKKRSGLNMYGKRQFSRILHAMMVLVLNLSRMEKETT